MAGFESPEILWFLLLLPILYYIHQQISQKKKQQAMKFSKVSFLKSVLADKKKTSRFVILHALTLAVIGLMIVGFANPHIPLKQQKEGVNVVLVLDVSGSMQATDYQPSRLESAKRSAEILLNSLEPKDHAGIVLFESGATTAAYLSPFKDAVVEKLKAITPREGKTAIGDGLSLGIDMAISIPNKKKVVILLSDGVNNAGVISPQEAIVFAQLHDIQVYTIGMGSEQPVILSYDFFGRPQYAELDEQVLKSIAAETNAHYFRSVDDQTLDDIYKNISQEIEREKEETNIKEWLFLSALLVFLLQWYLRYGGKRIIQ